MPTPLGKHEEEKNHLCIVSNSSADDRPLQVENERSLQQAQRKVHDDAAQTLHLLPIMLFFPVFWMLYDQQGSVWTLQATRMDLHGYQPEQLQILNPLQIMLLVPLFDRAVYPWCERRGLDLRPIRRMQHGMFLTAVSFVASAYLEHYVQSRPEQSVSVAWQVPQITILTLAEILLNVTGLEFAYAQAPANLQTLVLALYLFMTTIGDGLGAVLYATAFSAMDAARAMVVCALCMLINLALFSRVAGKWKPYERSHQTKAEGDVCAGDGRISNGHVELSSRRITGTQGDGEIL